MIVFFIIIFLVFAVLFFSIPITKHKRVKRNFENTISEQPVQKPLRNMSNVELDRFSECCEMRYKTMSKKSGNE